MTEIIDAQERSQALQPTQSFIVQAPAGSGKTELLIQRFLKLLSGVERPEQILAMTFTRKAAAEMKTRIMNALERANATEAPQTPHELHTWNLARKALEHDSQLGWRLLENPSRMKIQTIDSFSATLARQTPLLSGMGALLDVEENANELYRITAHRILDMVERDDDNGKAIRNIVSRLDNSKLSFLGRIIQLLQKRDQWIIPFFKKDLNTEETKIYLEQTLENIVTSFLIEANSLISNDKKSEITAFAAYAGSNLNETNPEHESAVLKDLREFPAPNLKHLTQWKGIANLLLTKEGSIRKTADKRNGFPAVKGEPKKKRDDFISFLESIACDQGMSEIIFEVMRLPHPRFSEEDWEFLKSIFLLLPELDNALRQVFMEKRKTDFTQIALSALHALGEEMNPSDLLLKLDMKIQHILVDEFQDISYKQFELIKLLTAGWTQEDGRTLFIVGDPMQSIYRFRDAEVGLFLKARDEGIGDLPLTSLKLKTNFRSQKKVVDWVNKCFSAIFPKVDDPDRGAIEYAPSIAAHPEDPDQGVVMHPVYDPASPEEAEEVTELIRQIKKDKPDDSIAILVRARTHLIEIVRKLHESNVKFRAEEIDPLTARPAILDLLSLMRALLSHSDRLSWLSILRSPFCGISLKDLHQLCWRDPKAPVWDLLNNKELTSQLSADGQQRIARLTEILSRVFEYFPQTNFRILLEAAWINLGGPACLDDSMMNDVTVFFDKVEEALETGEIENLQNFERVLKNLYANPETGEDNPVQIMTMHKAKGLEFDFVILPGLGKKSKTNTGRLVYWLPHGDHLLMAPMQEAGEPKSPAYDFLSRLDSAKDRFEVFRILYVSATRAKKQLHLFGHTETKEDEAKPPANSLIKSLWPYLQHEWNIALRQKQPVTKLPEKDPEPKIQISRLPADFHIPEPKPAIDTGPSIEISEEEDTLTFDWASNKVRLLGTVLHQCFNDIVEDGLETWNEARVNKLMPALKSALLGEGLSIKEVEQTCAEGIKTLNNVLNDKDGVWILSDHQESQAEYALTYREGNRFITRRIDRTFVDKDDVRWIIDYKVSIHSGAGEQKFFNDQRDRYRPQLERYEKLFKLNGESRTIKKALYFPIQCRLEEIKKIKKAGKT